MSNKSNINESFEGKSVLITGATGLVGKMILYKILHSVKSVRSIYILIRSKKGKSVSERFSEIISRSYGLLENIENEALMKIVPIKGDVTADGLGLNETDKNRIINDVSIVFHAAADVTFDTNLKKQLITNVVGTKHIIQLCRELKKLDVFVHVSTTYSNPLEMVTEEKVYMRTAHALDILDHINDPEFNFNHKELIGDFPNTYTFTKNLAENLVKLEYKKGSLPTTIVRPGLIATSIREPFCGWFDSITSIAGGMMLAGSGLARITTANLDVTGDAVPVDIVANTCIAAAWNTMTKYKSELRVYNCNTSCLCSSNVKQHVERGMYIYDEYPIWLTVRPVSNVNPTWIPVFLIRFFSELCFAYFLDFLLLLIGQKRIVVRYMKIYQRLSKTGDFFVSGQWYFTYNNFVKLSEELIGIDKNTFDCDARKIDWIKYGGESYFTDRKLLIKETDQKIYWAKTRYQFLKTGYTIVKHLLIYLLLSLLLTYTPLNSMIISLLNSVGLQSIKWNLKEIESYLLLMSALFNIVRHFMPKKTRDPLLLAAIDYAEQYLATIKGNVKYLEKF